MKGLNRTLAVLFEVTYVLFLVAVVLAPFHGMATRHLDVIQTFDASHAAITGDVSGLHIGQTVQLYRFNHDWEQPIGSGTIDALTPSTARVVVDPANMSWPLGRTGIVTQAASTTYVSLGSSEGIAEGQTLNLYRDRKNIGQVTVVRVEKTRSEIEVPIGIGEVYGTTASEFTFATQATVYDAPLLSLIEIAVITLALLAYAFLWWRARRSPFLVVGERLRAGESSRSFWWLINIVVGVPFVWFLVKMPLYLFAYVVAYISQHFFAQYIYLYPAMDALLPYGYALLAILYYVYLGRYGKSPVIEFWKRISYKGRSKVTKPSVQRGIILWALHLVIVYAFGSTLLDFLRGDLAAAAAIGFPAPSQEALFQQLKFLLWSLTVVGVLIGYGYSVISIFWGKFMRNLDFTVTGWLTNGFCYPLFGVVIWQMIPAFTGVDPIITGGPLEELVLWLGLILNLLYTLSIFNLGVLFDLMADKGVRWNGFYSIIRHPNYMLESSMFLMTELVGLTGGVQWAAISMYFFLYWIRSEREDNFMQWSNPEYSEYQKATPYKFIPGLY